MFRRCVGRFLNALCTFNLHPVSRGWILSWCFINPFAPCTALSGWYTDPPTDVNISKLVGVNIAFVGTIFKECSISFLMVCWRIDFALVVLEVLMFKVCGILASQKSSFSIFPIKKGLKLSSVFLIGNNCSLWNHCSQFLA